MTEKALTSIDLRLLNDLYCVEWGVKLYSLTHAVSDAYH